MEFRLHISFIQTRINLDCIYPMLVNASWTNIIQTALWRAGKKSDDLIINTHKNPIEDSKNSKIKRNKSSLNTHDILVCYKIHLLSQSYRK